MPWRGANYPGEFPTLGYDVADWIEAHCVVPDGDHVGQPFILTDEQLRFLLFHYRIDPATGKFFYRRSQLVRPQKWGKGPLTAAIICAEAEGDVVPDGWDADGEPVGRPWATPWTQVTAVSQDQTDNIWRCLQPMIELGPLADVIPDTGETRINLRGGGRIEPVTASAKSRLGLDSASLCRFRTRLTAGLRQTVDCVLQITSAATSQAWVGEPLKRPTPGIRLSCLWPNKPQSRHERTSTEITFLGLQHRSTISASDARL